MLLVCKLLLQFFVASLFSSMLGNFTLLENFDFSLHLLLCINNEYKEGQSPRHSNLSGFWWYNLTNCVQF